jgi:glycerol-3-phosphate O-acyltransferase
MYDTAGKLLVWTGRAHKAIDVNSSQEERQKNLDNAGETIASELSAKVISRLHFALRFSFSHFSASEVD